LISRDGKLLGFDQNKFLKYGVGSNPKKVQHNDVFTRLAKLSKGRGKFIKAEQIMNTFALMQQMWF
jgi:hypothetical protein